jgi:hypothetical protein
MGVKGVTPSRKDETPIVKCQSTFKECKRIDVLHSYGPPRPVPVTQHLTLYLFLEGKNKVDKSKIKYSVKFIER